MKHIITLLVLALFANTGYAEIYKGTDAEGNVIYSDEEMPDATEIQIPEPTSIPMPKPKPKALVKDEKKQAVGYKSFKILSPGNDETLRISSGNVSVTLSVTPALNIEQGHRISVYIDGVATIKKTTRLNLQIPNVNRGSHNLRAEIRNTKNKILKKSNTVKFHMKRFSIQHKKPAGASSGPRKPDGSPYTSGPQNVIFEPGPITLLPSP